MAGIQNFDAGKHTQEVQDNVIVSQRMIRRAGSIRQLESSILVQPHESNVFPSNGLFLVHFQVISQA